MAVPGSGAITMLGIAQERKYGTYGSGTISSPITMFELLNGGGANAFPSLNSCPQPNVPSYSMSGWYGYNQSASCSTCNEIYLLSGRDPFSACTGREPFPYYTPSDFADQPWRDNSPIYTDPQCTIEAAEGYYSSGSEYAFYSRSKWSDIGPCEFR